MQYPEQVLGDNPDENRRAYKEIYIYYSPEDKQANARSPTADNPVYDIYAYPTQDSPDDRRKIVEVETTTEHKSHVQEDYEKLSSTYGDGIWVVDTFKSARQLINHINEVSEEQITVRRKKFDTLTSDIDDTGMSNIFGINKLREELQ